MSCGGLNLPDNFGECGNVRPNAVYTINGKSLYRNGKYYGFIIYQDEKLIRFVCDNGNEYMQGKTMEILIVGNSAT